jgi:hypothetical protein
MSSTHNPVVSTAHFGPVYRRKIDLYAAPLDARAAWAYAYSTNAYPTCRAAVHAARLKQPDQQFKAYFSRS